MGRKPDIPLFAVALVAATPVFAQASSFNPCPFKPAEVQAAFGVSFAAGKAAPPLNSGTTAHPLSGAKVEGSIRGKKPAV